MRTRRLRRLGAAAISVMLLLTSCSAEPSAVTPTEDLRAFPEVPLDTPVPTPPPTPTPEERAGEVAPVEGNETAPAACGVVGSEQEIAIFPGDWQVGEGRNLEITKIQSQLPNIVSVTPATVEVMEATEAGYLLRWTTGKTVLEGASAMEQQAFGLLGGLADGIAIDYAVSPEGWFLGVRNPDEITDAVREAFDLIQALEGESMTPAERAQLSQVVDLMISNPQFIETVATDPQSWHGFYGEVYIAGEEIEFRADLPNAFGGPDFPGTSIVSVLPLEADGCAHIIAETRPDPDEFFDVLFESLGAIGAEAGVPGAEESAEMTPEEREEFAAASISSTLALVFDEESGWPTRSVDIRAISLGPVSQTESTTIVDLGPLEG